MARRDNIPIFTGGPRGGGGGGGSGSGGGTSGGGGPRKPGGSGKKKGGGSPSTGNAAYDAQIRKQNRQDKETRRNLLSQAKILADQAASLRRALGNDGFRAALNTRLANIQKDLTQQDQLLMEGYNDRVSSLEGASKDNDAAASDQSQANLSNRARERTNALSQAMSQGAGESDALRAEQMSLRSWEANQGEISRGFHDTLRSIRSSLADLNVDTKTARANLYLQAGEDRETAWQNFYTQQGDTWTNLGNIYGQAANTLGQADVLGTGRGKGKEWLSPGEVAVTKKGNAAAARDAFNKAAKFAGKAYADPGVPASVMGWEGTSDVSSSGYLGSSAYQQDDDAPARKRPEGASLRKWE